MNYNDAFNKLNLKIQKQRNLRLQKYSSFISFGTFQSLLFRQGSYLLWTMALTVIQLLEIYILASSYSIFLSPVSLQILKLTSSLTIAGVLAAYISRNLPFFEGNSADTLNNFRDKNFILFTARIMFLIFGLIALALTFYILTLSQLSLATPPIYRMIILAGIISLPFDVFNTYIFYNYRSLDTGWQPAKLRSISVTIYFFSLILLIFNLPLLYLLCKLTPRFIVTIQLLVRTGNGKLNSFLEISGQEASRYFKELKIFLLELLRPLSLYIILDASFYITFSYCSRHDSNFSLLLFVAHKMLHLLTILGIKSMFSLSRELFLMKVINDKSEQRTATMKIISGLLHFILIAVFFLPLFSVKQLLFLWADPTGEYFSGTIGLYLLLAVDVILRSYAALLPCRLTSIKRKGRTEVSLILLALFLSITINYAAIWLNRYYYLEDVLIFILSADIIVVLALIIALSIYLRDSVFRSPQQPLTDINTFLQKCAFAPTIKILLLELNNISPNNQGYAELRQYIQALDDKSFLSTEISRLTFLLANEDFNRLRKGLDQVIEQYPALIKSYKFLNSEDLAESGSKDTLIDFSKKLFFSAWNHQGNHSEVSRAAQNLYQRLLNGSETEVIALDYLGSSWGLERICDPEIKKQVISYLSLLELKKDYLAISLQRMKKFNGIFHINKHGKPQRLIYLPPAQRFYIFELRQQAFAHNLKNIIDTAREIYEK